MVTTQELASAYIYRQHGWAVAEQFDSVYDDGSKENLSEQNLNALRYIEQALAELVEDSDVLSEDAVEDLHFVGTIIRNFLAEVPNLEKKSD